MARCRGGSSARDTPSRPSRRKWRNKRRAFCCAVDRSRPYQANNNITSFYGSSCAYNNNGKNALNTPYLANDKIPVCFTGIDWKIVSTYEPKSP
eukprot:5941551-Pyramimonas_sp.AAC.1